MWGACGIAPWPFTWGRYLRLFLGWRRYHWEMTAELAAAVSNGQMGKKNGGVWSASDYCHLILPPPRRLPRKSSSVQEKMIRAGAGRKRRKETPRRDGENIPRRRGRNQGPQS